MKIVVLIAGGRTGSDFFQSLLDGHPEISQFPGIFRFDDFWEKTKKENKLENIAKILIDNYKHFFDSKKNLIERHNMLGKDKNDFFSIDENLYKKCFINLMKNKDLNKKNLLIGLNLAYSQASNEDHNKKKIILLHLHRISGMKIIEDLEFEIIYTIRDPLAAYTSAINHWYKFRNEKHMNPQAHFFHMDRFFNGLKDTLSFQKKTHVIQLEKLHIENVRVMKAFCTTFDISYNETMSKSTYHGKVWWGDKLSEKDLNGVNPNFQNKIDESLFFKKDIECLETYLKIFLLKYNYPFRSKGLKLSFMKYLPLKAALKIWRDAITPFNIKNFISIFIYWYKRVNLMNKKIHDKVNFPNSIEKKIIN